MQVKMNNVQEEHPFLFMLQGQNNSFKQYIFTETFFVKKCELGFGTFATRRILEGEMILVFGGPLIDFSETKRRRQWECMPIQIGPNQYIDTQPPGVFVNHSCTPNAGVSADRNLIALRQIEQGEEIRFDYSTTMEEGSFTMRCMCGATNCRGIVDDFSTLPNELKAKYLNGSIVMSFISKSQ
jgi:uncharacterized protein